MKILDFPGGTSGKESTCNAGDAEMQVQSLGREDLLEEEMATHTSILAWRNPWTEESGGLQSMRSQRAGSDLACTLLSSVEYEKRNTASSPLRQKLSSSN